MQLLWTCAGYVTIYISDNDDVKKLKRFSRCSCFFPKTLKRYRLDPDSCDITICKDKKYTMSRLYFQTKNNCVGHLHHWSYSFLSCPHITEPHGPGPEDSEAVQPLDFLLSFQCSCSAETNSVSSLSLTFGDQVLHDCFLSLL